MGPEALSELLGPQRLRTGMREETARLGLVNGLAVSPWGGEVLAIEVVPVPGTGQILLTGRLGDWLKESANAARTYVCSRAVDLGLPEDVTRSPTCTFIAQATPSRRTVRALASPWPPPWLAR